MKIHTLMFLLLIISTAVLFMVNVCVGSVPIPLKAVMSILTGNSASAAGSTWEYIILESRLPQAVTATLCGGAVALSGLMLQTAFHNPLAGPGIFGISSGAGLGVAIVMLAMGGGIMASDMFVSGYLAVLLAAFAGAMLVMGIIFFFSHFVRNDTMLLIIGIMVGYVSSSAISLLNFFATEEGVKSYMIWGMGNFGSVSNSMLPLFAVPCLAGMALSMLLVKPLNALLLGESYASNLGVDTRRVRNCLILLTGLLTAVTTAFCGPIGFIGLAVPHLARLIMHTSNHKILMPATILMGSVVALACNVACCLPASGVVPLNAVTPIVGAPVIIYVILRNK